MEDSNSERWMATRMAHRLTLNIPPSHNGMPPPLRVPVDDSSFCLLLQAWILFFSLILSALHYWRVFTINILIILCKVIYRPEEEFLDRKTHSLFFCRGLYFQLINRFLVFRYIFCAHVFCVLCFVFCVLWLSEQNWIIEWRNSNRIYIGILI
jgi:hypothetical protein